MDLFNLLRLGNSQSQWEFPDDVDVKQSPPAPPSDDAMPSESADHERSSSCEIGRTGNADNIECVKKKSKKRSKKKKGRSRANSACSEAPLKHVHWGQVDEILFDRNLGEHTVPNNGLYPIALGEECERTETSVDNHVETQQLHLLQRVIDKGLNLDVLSKPVTEVTEGNTCISGACVSPLETRQWDYRQGARNPLFVPLPETDRCVTAASVHSFLLGVLPLPPCLTFG